MEYDCPEEPPYGTVLWAHRTQASSDPALLRLRSSIEDGFSVLDANIGLLEQMILESGLARIACLLACKGKQLAFCCYSLTLDGLARESGALLRPLLEILDLMVFIRTVPGALGELLVDKPPSAGKIAGTIQSRKKWLRDYLNRAASHVSVTPESLGYLLSFQSDPPTCRITPLYSQSAVGTNMGLVGFYVLELIIECVQCYEKLGDYPSDLADRGETFRQALLAWGGVATETPEE